MQTIDADAHVIESEGTWDYMEGAERKYRPQIVSSTDSGEEKEYWLIDGRLVPRNKDCHVDGRGIVRLLGNPAARRGHKTDGVSPVGNIT